MICKTKLKFKIKSRTIQMKPFDVIEDYEKSVFEMLINYGLCIKLIQSQFIR